MNYKLKNSNLTLEVSSVGGEIQSIKNEDNVEYLWQGDPEFWGRRALNLFPYVGRLYKKCYYYKEKKYPLEIHGFSADAEYTALENDGEKLLFEMQITEEMHRRYPFTYSYQIEYRLIGHTVRISYIVRNLGQETMYFGLGGHPGFFVPQNGEGKLNDCYLEFDDNYQPMKVGMSEGKLQTGNDTIYPLEEKKILPLSLPLFDDGAIILRDVGHCLALKSRKNNHGVRLTFPQMNNVCLWHKPHKEAPFVCIEPWTSLQGKEGIIEDIEKQQDLISLVAGKSYVNTWQITVF